MGAGKSKSVDVEEQGNKSQETPSSHHFQVDADFFDLSDPEKQKSADADNR